MTEKLQADRAGKFLNGLLIGTSVVVLGAAWWLADFFYMSGKEQQHIELCDAVSQRTVDISYPIEGVMSTSLSSVKRALILEHENQYYGWVAHQEREAEMTLLSAYRALLQEPSYEMSGKWSMGKTAYLLEPTKAGAMFYRPTLMATLTQGPYEVVLPYFMLPMVSQNFPPLPEDMKRDTSTIRHYFYGQ